MATRHQVHCHKPDNNDADRRIQGIGGANPDGTRWYLPIDDAISAIETNKYSFFVRVQGKEVNVIVGKRPNGRKYLTTEGDGFPPNNLLALPTCP